MAHDVDELGLGDVLVQRAHKLDQVRLAQQRPPPPAPPQHLLHHCLGFRSVRGMMWVGGQWDRDRLCLCL